VWVQAEGNNAPLELTYLYYDDNEGVHIRSGKVVGDNRSFAAWDAEHKVGARLEKPADRESDFYNFYPDPTSTHISADVHRRGYSTNLRQLVAIGLDRSDAAAVRALCIQKDGILLWSKEVMKYVSKLNFAGAETTLQKQLHMVGYLFELHYDLLAKQHNVSRSPGFEHCLGIYGNK
jgi:hypothetical protein